MANSSAEKKFTKAKALRAQTKGVRSPSARKDIEDAAQRFEDQGAAQVRKLARRKRKKATKLA